MKKLLILLALFSVAATTTSAPAPTWQEKLKEKAKTYWPALAGIAAGTGIFFADEINGSKSLYDEYYRRVGHEEGHWNSYSTADQGMRLVYPLRWPLAKMIEGTRSPERIPILDVKQTIPHVVGFFIINFSLLYGLYQLNKEYKINEKIKSWFRKAPATKQESASTESAQDLKAENAKLAEKIKMLESLAAR